MAGVATPATRVRFVARHRTGPMADEPTATAAAERGEVEGEEAGEVGEEAARWARRRGGGEAEQQLEAVLRAFAASASPAAAAEEEEDGDGDGDGDAAAAAGARPSRGVA